MCLHTTVQRFPLTVDPNLQIYAYVRVPYAFINHSTMFTDALSMLNTKCLITFDEIF